MPSWDDEPSRFAHWLWHNKLPEYLIDFDESFQPQNCTQWDACATIFCQIVTVDRNYLLELCLQYSLKQTCSELEAMSMSLDSTDLLLYIIWCSTSIDTMIENWTVLEYHFPIDLQSLMMTLRVQLVRPSDNMWNHAIIQVHEGYENGEPIDGKWLRRLQQ